MATSNLFPVFVIVPWLLFRSVPVTAAPAPIWSPVGNKFCAFDDAPAARIVVYIKS